MAKPETHSLELVPTQDLATELLNRFGHAVFVGMRDGQPRNPRETLWEWRGLRVECLGLCAMVRREIENYQPPDDNEAEVIADGD